MSALNQESTLQRIYNLEYSKIEGMTLENRVALHPNVTNQDQAKFAYILAGSVFKEFMAGSFLCLVSNILLYRYRAKFSLGFERRVIRYPSAVLCGYSLYYLTAQWYIDAMLQRDL